jgi:predicted dehydrogenase
MKVKRRKILVVGCGGIGERHIRVLSHMDGVSVSVCDVNSALLERMQKVYRVDKVYGNWANADLDLFDAVIISTPANMHVPMIIDALNSNCHVLCEKPLSLSTEGIDNIKSLAQERNRIAGVAYIYRSMPGIRLMREKILSGEIGDIRSVSVITGSDFPFYRPDYRKIYYNHHSTGGGALHDAVSHMINLVEWCMGHVEGIYCIARHLVLPGVDVEDTVSCVMTFDNTDALCTLSLNQFQKKDEMLVEFAGTDGMIRFDGTSQKIGICKENSGDFVWSKPMSLSRDEYHELQFESFFNAIDNNEPFICTIEDAEVTLRTILAAHASAEQNIPVNILQHSEMASLLT